MSLAYFPFYADRYEADTAHLSMLEDGAYNRLLRLCWRSPGCKLPNDMAWIFRQLRAHSEADKAAVTAVLDEYFAKGRGKIWSDKLLKVYMQVSVAHQSKSEAGKKGAAAKALKNKKTEASTAKAQLKQPLSIKNQNQNQTEREEGGGGSAQARPEASIFERVLAAVGLDPTKPPKAWQSAAAATHVLGWQLVHGLTDDELVVAVGSAPPANAETGPAMLDLVVASAAKAKRATAARSAAPPPQDTLREHLLAAMGVDPVSGLTGRGGGRLGTQADMALAAQWVALPGMTPEIVCAEVARIVADKADGLPNSFKYFTPAMERLSGALTAPPLEPSQTSAPNPKGNRHDRAAFDRTIHAVADGLDSGEITLDMASRDPFAALPR